MSVDQNDVQTYNAQYCGIRICIYRLRAHIANEIHFNLLVSYRCCLLSLRLLFLFLISSHLARNGIVIYNLLLIMSKSSEKSECACIGLT